jgi:DNA-binding MarR family transcriptional regulator
MSERADTLALSRSGATRLIDRLETDALVERLSCETDRRGQWAQLTADGYERLRTASPTHLRGVAAHFLDRIPASELDALRSTLERVLERA